MRSDTEVALACSMTASLNLKRKSQLSVLLSSVVEASLPGEPGFGHC